MFSCENSINSLERTRSYYSSYRGGTTAVDRYYRGYCFKCQGASQEYVKRSGSRIATDRQVIDSKINIIGGSTATCAVNIAAARSTEVMEIERHNAEEDKYSYTSSTQVFAATTQIFLLSGVMLVLEVFANHRQSLIATYALGLPSIVIIMSVGALRSNIRPQRKFYNIIMSIYATFSATVNAPSSILPLF